MARDGGRYQTDHAVLWLAVFLAGSHWHLADPGAGQKRIQEQKQQ